LRTISLSYIASLNIQQLKDFCSNILFKFLCLQERAPNCSVIIIGTFLDKAESLRKNYVDDMRKEIQKRFVAVKFGGGVLDLTEKGLPSVVHVIEVNSKSQRSVAKVRDLVYDTVTTLKANKKSIYIYFRYPAFIN